MATAVSAVVVHVQPAHGTADHRAGGPAEQEPTAGQPVAGADGVGLLDVDHLVDEGRVEQRRAHVHAQARDHPPGCGGPEADRTDGVDRDDPHRRPPLLEPAGAAHQRPGGTGSDEQDVQVRELPGDRRRRGAVVRLPGVGIGVLVDPDVPVVVGAQLLDEVHSRTEQTAYRIRLGDDVHLGAQCLHQQPGRQVAPRVGHAEESVAAARGNHAQRHAEIPRRGLHQECTLPQQALPLCGLHHRGRGLQLDGAGEVETFALQEKGTIENRPKVDVQPVLVEFVRAGNYRHYAPQVQLDFDCSAHRVETRLPPMARPGLPPGCRPSATGASKYVDSEISDTSGYVRSGARPSCRCAHRLRERSSLWAADTRDGQVRAEIIELVTRCPLRIRVAPRARSARR